MRSGVVDARGSPTAERGAEAARDDAAMIEMRAKRSIVSELFTERERRLSSVRCCDEQLQEVAGCGKNGTPVSLGPSASKVSK